MPTTLPIACETEKREKINSMKSIFFNKFIKKPSAKNEDMEIQDQCFSDDIKFSAILELINEPNSAYFKKNVDHVLQPLKDKLKTLSI